MLPNVPCGVETIEISIGRSVLILMLIRIDVSVDVRDIYVSQLLHASQTDN